MTKKSKRWGQYEKALFNANTNMRYGKLADRMTLRQKFLLNSLYGQVLKGPLIGEHKHAYVIVAVKEQRGMVFYDHEIPMDPHYYVAMCVKCGTSMEVFREMFWNNSLSLMPWRKTW